MTTVKAIKETITVAGIAVDTFQLPDSSYLYSQTSAAKAIDKADNSVLQFLGSKRVEALPFKGFTSYKLPVDGSKTRINGIPAELVTAYWSYWAAKGDAKAIALMNALAVEALERRADAAFIVIKTEQEYEQQTADKYQEILELITRKVEIMKMKQTTKIRKNEKAYQALLEEERSLRNTLTFEQQDLANQEYNTVTLQKLVEDTKDCPEVQERWQKALDHTIQERDRLRSVVTPSQVEG